ncbi:MAG: YraN family protein [Candidatus Paceibacterota bacterium]|jgi:putative endonuclease
MNHLAIGKMGEQLAKNYLESQRYKILFTNYRFRHLEIDIIASKSQTIYFVEVKTRHYQNYQPEKDLNITPEEEFTCSKKQKFIKASELFLIQNYQLRNRHFQLMLIAVYLFDDHEPIYKIYETISNNL